MHIIHIIENNTTQIHDFESTYKIRVLLAKYSEVLMKNIRRVPAFDLWTPILKWCLMQTDSQAAETDAIDCFGLAANFRRCQFPILYSSHRIEMII